VLCLLLHREQLCVKKLLTNHNLHVLCSAQSGVTFQYIQNPVGENNSSDISLWWRWAGGKKRIKQEDPTKQSLWYTRSSEETDGNRVNFRVNSIDGYVSRCVCLW
jgi:hypothetical protein